MNIQNTQSINYKSDRIFGLDIFRAVAILLIVSGHGNFLLENTFLNNFPYIKMIDGVDLFFVLSGFLIGSILIREINSTEKFGMKELTIFWKRRWLRTLPNYYLILLVNYIIVHNKVINGDINQFNWKFIVFLQNFSSPFYDFFWESWSLSVEEWFYISAPLLLMTFLVISRPKIAFLSVTILMIVAPFLYRIYASDYSFDNFWYDVRIRKVVITRLDGIAYGLLAAWIFYYFERHWTKFKIPSLIIGVSLIAFIVNYEVPNNTFYKQVFYFSISPIAAMFLLPYAHSIKNGTSIIANPITHISKISYSMYLINLAIVAEVIQINFPPINALDSIIKYVIYWIIVLVGSTILYTYFEKPIMKLRD